MVTCNHCGSDVADLDGFGCNYCGSTHCADHRLPEQHDCPFQRVAESDGKRRDSREETEFVRADPIGHERKPPAPASSGRVERDTPDEDITSRRELPTCEDCGVVCRGEDVLCTDCREATTGETARGGNLANRSRIVADGGLRGGRWRRLRWLKLRSLPYREVAYLVVAVVVLHVLGAVDVPALLGGVLQHG